MTNNNISSYAFAIYVKNNPGSVIVRAHNNDPGASFWGAYNGLPTSIDMRLNNWGGPSGPFNAALNPSSLGSQVNARLIFSPWLGGS